MNFDLEQVYDKPGWLTLQEASRITGLNTFTLRKRIKSGKLSGKKVNQNNREVWLVYIDSPRIPQKVDINRLNPSVNNELDNEPVNDEPIHEILPKAHKYTVLLLNQKDQRICELVHHSSELSRHNRVLEQLLTDFQARINILESDKLHLEHQMRLLPAPPEHVTEELRRKEEKLADFEKLLQQERNFRQNIEFSLQSERAKPWWKKLFGLK